MAHFFRVLLPLCAVLATVQAQDVLRFQEQQSFSKQLYSQFTGNASLLIGNLPGERLEIHSLADHLNALKLSEIPATEETLALAMEQNRLLRLTADALFVYDLKIPAQPVLLDTIVINEGLGVMKMHLVGNRVYLGGALRGGTNDFVLRTAVLDDPAPAFVPVTLEPGSVRVHHEWLIDGRSLYILEGLRIWIYDLKTAEHAFNRRLHDPNVFGFSPRLRWFQDKVVFETGESIYLYDPDTPELSRSFQTHHGRNDAALEINGLYFVFSQFGYDVYDLMRETNAWVAGNTFLSFTRSPIYDPARDLLFHPWSGGYRVVENPVAAANSGTEVTVREGYFPFDDAAVQGDRLAVSTSRQVVLLQQDGHGGFDELATIDTPFYAHDLAWFGDFLMVRSADGRWVSTRIYSLQDPRQPVLVFEIEPDLITRDGNRVARFARDEPRILVQDWQNPLRPKLLDLVPFPSDFAFESSQDRGILLSDDLLFFLNGLHLLVYQRIEGTYQVTARVELPLTTDAGALALHGSMLLVGGNDVIAYDISDPSQPQRRGSLTRPNRYAIRERFVGVVDGALFYLQDRDLTVVDVTDPDNLSVVPFDAGGSHRFVKIQDGMLLAGLYSPGRLAVGPIDFCTAPEVTTAPVDTFLCPGENTTLSAAATGEGLVYQWYRDGEPIDGAVGADLMVADLDQITTYVCRMESTCATVETEPVQVIPTVCDVALAYAFWQTNDYFCQTQNPSVLDFIAAFNHGGTCP